MVALICRTIDITCNDLTIVTALRRLIELRLGEASVTSCGALCYRTAASCGELLRLVWRGGKVEFGLAMADVDDREIDLPLLPENDLDLLLVACAAELHHHGVAVELWRSIAVARRRVVLPEVEPWPPWLS